MLWRSERQVVEFTVHDFIKKQINSRNKKTYTCLNKQSYAGEGGGGGKQQTPQTQENKTDYMNTKL